ncbi:molecular chaperone HscC [Amylibacter sp. SFDW26]|uniref:Hsp70 family protein n=1 Tax=Amylibacter sp. SFDW26 TaxID=2652722 RepID=UPI001262AA36|nr:molecular chaperone HscC [Amylibacter sp. SFDW26]KAB7615215.1 molecular chaperone HscC [Amylibacter sp. SFDW26]
MIIGIDLGTTNSLVSVFGENGPELIPNSLGSYLTPSAVFFDKSGNSIVGESAKNHLVTNGDSSTSKFKRLMGTNQLTNIARKNMRPEDLSALVLRSLKSDAEAYLGCAVEKAVISVPAYFNDIQRKATVAAAEIAGLSVERLINEPTAAALAYGLHDKDGEDTFLVVDLGGGTFDVSILEMFSGVMEVRSSAGDAFLGGEDFTDRIVEYFCEKMDLVSDKMLAEDLSRLRLVADRAKIMLCDEMTANVSYRNGEEEVALSISRDKLESISKDLINRTKIPLQRAISDAGLTASEIDRIVLVGGATRMILVRNLITRLFKRFPEHELDPDTVVALGAAVQAGLISRNAALEDMVMTDVCPFTLGYETSRQTLGHEQFEHGIFSPLIERNTTIPVSRNHIVTAMQKGQKEIDIRVFQGEAPYVRDNIKIGSYKISLPYNMKEHEEVDIRFTYDSSGVLEVISTVVSTGKESKLIIEGNPGTLTGKEIEKRFKELEKIKVHPRDEAQNEALIARISAAYENALGERRSAISSLLSEFEHALASFDKRRIEEVRSVVEERLQYLEASNAFD